MRIVRTKMKLVDPDSGVRISAEKASVKLNSHLQIMK
jgi:hypothetical protein